RDIGAGGVVELDGEAAIDAALLHFRLHLAVQRLEVLLAVAAGGVGDADRVGAAGTQRLRQRARIGRAAGDIAGPSQRAGRRRAVHRTGALSGLADIQIGAADRTQVLRVEREAAVAQPDRVVLLVLDRDIGVMAVLLQVAAAGQQGGLAGETAAVLRGAD